MSVERQRLYFSGHVQGVGFRLTAQRLARRFGVIGYARNLPDGRVEVLAEAEDQSLRSFLDELHRELQAKIRGTESESVSSDVSLPQDFQVQG